MLHRLKFIISVILFFANSSNVGLPQTLQKKKPRRSFSAPWRLLQAVYLKNREHTKNTWWFSYLTSRANIVHSGLLLPLCNAHTHVNPPSSVVPDLLYYYAVTWAICGDVLTPSKPDFAVYGESNDAVVTYKMLDMNKNAQQRNGKWQLTSLSPFLFQKMYSRKCVSWDTRKGWNQSYKQYSFNIYLYLSIYLL